MFINELRLSLDFLRDGIVRCHSDFSERMIKSIDDCRENLERGIEHYRELAATNLLEKRELFTQGLELIQHELAALKDKTPTFV